jgi:radical SAM superfamily enzyme YgiQ (UPF0313 family)
LKANSVKVADIDEAVKLFRESNIILGGNFVYGSPTETLKEMKENFKFFIDTPKLFFMNANVFTPYPGTTAWLDLGLDKQGADYIRMLPTNELDVSVNYSGVSDEKFFRFLRDLKRMQWFIQKVRVKPCLKTFFGLWRAKCWWWLWLMHPAVMIKVLVKCKLRYNV